VLAVVLAGLITFVVTRLRSELTSEIDSSVRSGAVQIGLGYQAEGEKEFRDSTHAVLPGPRNRGAGAQILSRSGAVLFNEGDPVTRSALVGSRVRERALRGGRVVQSLRPRSPPGHFRAIAVPVTRAGQRQVLVVIESLAEVDRAVHRALILLLVGSAAALALIALGGWWIASKALGPVGRMTSRAERIGIDDLSERISVPRVKDEVGHLARTLNAMLDRLQAGVEARQRLVADASHELRAPLAAMRSQLEVSLRQDALSSEARAVLSSVREDVVRMGIMVDNLLTLARVDEGRLDLLVQPQDLRELAKETARTHQTAADAAGVGLVVEGDQAAVAGDRDRLRQVIGNLVDNAIDFAPPGSAVRIATWRENGSACVGVSDEGPGVPADARERIFERFSREDPARQRGGAGLGLAICREIVLAHGGSLSVRDTRPRGTTFIVSLPDGGDNLEPPEPAAHSWRSASSGSSSAARRAG
ncbi:MAG TPA: ATP-binding protein, partial [Solirubrobacteraceae bacterium]|nr:ATP-binding protein [Solirubrobacteraceae bacterium]